jgi:dihydrofolate reductase
MSARQVALFMVVTLDGFFEGPNHELDWHHVDADFEDFAAKQLNAADVLLFGRKTYQLMADFWPSDTGKKNSPEIAALMNGMPKIVFSKTLSALGWQMCGSSKITVPKKAHSATGQRSPCARQQQFLGQFVRDGIARRGSADVESGRAGPRPLALQRLVPKVRTVSRRHQGVSFGKHIADLPKKIEDVRMRSPPAAKRLATNPSPRESLFT